MRIAFAASLAMLCLAGCREATEIVVVINSDLTVPDQLDGVRLEIKHYVGGSPSQEGKEWKLPQQIKQLPVLQPIYKGKSSEDKLELVAIGLKGANELVRRTASVRFVAGRIRLLRMDLLRGCIKSGCRALVDDDLRPWDDNEANRPLPPSDGGLTLERRSSDARVDAPVDRRRTEGPTLGSEGKPKDGSANDKPQSIDTKPWPKVDSKPWPDVKAWPDALPVCVPQKTHLGCGGGWCTLNVGCFHMGSPTTEPCRNANEPLHTVYLKHKFKIMAKEVTVFEFRTVTGDNVNFTWLDSGLKNPAKCDACAMSAITWHQAANYCNKLSQPSQQCFSCSSSNATTSCSLKYVGKDYYNCLGYRLPTEAEWEYAARAGTETPLSNGPIDTCTGVSSNANPIAFYFSNSSVGQAQCPKVPGQRNPNAWGLYDMHGNVSEWTVDSYSSDPTGGGMQSPVDPIMTGGTTGWVARGGCFASEPRDLRSAWRWGPAVAYPEIGFRCVQTVP